MKREDVKKLLPILQAFAEGKTIQSNEFGKWKDIVNFNFALRNTNSYRIKPESK